MLFVQPIPLPSPVRPMPILLPSAAATSPSFIPFQVRCLKFTTLTGKYLSVVVPCSATVSVWLGLAA